ncbi:MAG: peptidase MA family metallohydrolase [Anaerolineales bacterium]
MTRSRSFVFLLLLLLVVGLVTPAHAQSDIQVVSDSASLTFPESILFNAEFQAGSNITSVVLEYGVNQLTCGTVEAKAFPPLTPGRDVKVNWAWQMRESGSLPPGATVWWNWQVVDSGGTQFTSPTKTVLWLDNIHPWQVIQGGKINLHYYNGGASFGQQLHDAAAQALARLSQDVGVGTDSPVDVYIYANSDDLQSSILYAPAWVGGQAFPESDIVIIGISPDQLDWGKATEAHELTHVLVGHLTFSCLGFIPTWLNEGLAMYGEGGVQPEQQAQFDQAKAADQLPSLRSLTGAFSDEANRANLSYTEAYSVVDFMIKTYGHDKMIALLLDLRDGQTMDQALQAVYGFDTDGLENTWRLAIGAKTHAGSANPTPLSTPTEVPTFVPVGAAPLAAALASTPVAATPAASPTTTALPPAQQTGLNLGTFTTLLKYALACLVIAMLLAGLVIFLIVRGQNRSRK